MAPDAFKAALARIGLTPGGYARLTGRPRTTVANWIGKQATPIPALDAEWIARRVADIERDPPPGRKRD